MADDIVSKPVRSLRPTAIEVAERAGVSQSTVSRALSGHPSVTPETRERITAIARDMGYMVDVHAARLRRGSSGTIALVVLLTVIDGQRTINPLYHLMVQSISDAAAARRLDLLVSFQGGDGDYFGRYQDSNRADGVIVIGSAQNAAAWAHFRGLAEEGRNLLGWGAPDDHPWVVRSDNHGGGRLATERLIAGGRRRILFIGPGSGRQQAFAEREAGYRAALADAGLAPLAITDLPTLPRDAQGRAAVARLFDEGGECDAIFAASDEIAIGAMAAVQESGRRVPDDVAVVGFDGIVAGRYTSPALTTVAQDLDLAGAVLVDRLLGGDGAGQRLPVRLLARGSG